MTTEQIARRLKELCNKGAFNDALKELFSPDAVSLEPFDTPDFAKETRGMEAILAKGKKWNDMVTESHALEISDPLIGQDSFAVTMYMDVTMKERGRMKHKELCVYQVKDGKIISEQFFM